MAVASLTRPVALCLEEDIADRQDDSDRQQAETDDRAVAEKDPGDNASERQPGQGRQCFILF